MVISIIAQMLPLVHDKKPWGYNHRLWIAETFPLSSQQIAFQHYCQSPEQIQAPRACASPLFSPAKYRMV
ncbi:TPA_asm: hypothetical protein G4Q23_004811 [Salmonella enterica subsp. enterica serovar Eastbourne]|uniref:Uncharacterized protein n=1 Tax=Salmonella enterica subsp. enterica serovar Eastbourne TaxID=486993 RepID=A0A702F9E1_SALET|nr:hypothetical protein [Salmonella enterica subsp. enterica serovar Eastbourne]HAC6678912.1 hypothetical protein [Salmonella enterica subsp. enterica serovar Eastbourne]HAE5116397.1 hypothetical protein [Salmonella enterica subsp. enterica serovar Eastbourne]HAE8030745.1 hypothetical protein [Salmonella enterica subsp. enterica serovar Eastbourne]